MAERKGLYRILGRGHEGKRLLGLPRGRWDEIIMMEVQEVGCGGME
jgi:hypothetical protein